MVLRGQQRADVALEHEVGLHGPLDRLADLRISRVREFPNLPADLLLPGGQRVDVGVHPRIPLTGHRRPPGPTSCPGPLRLRALRLCDHVVTDDEAAAGKQPHGDPLEPVHERDQRGHGEQHQTSGGQPGGDIGHPVRAQVDRGEPDRGGEQTARHAPHPPVPAGQERQQTPGDDGVRGVPGREDRAVGEHLAGAGRDRLRAQLEGTQPADRQLDQADRHVEQQGHDAEGDQRSDLPPPQSPHTQDDRRDRQADAALPEQHHPGRGLVQPRPRAGRRPAQHDRVHAVDVRAGEDGAREGHVEHGEHRGESRSRPQPAQEDGEARRTARGSSTGGGAREGGGTGQHRFPP